MALANAASVASLLPIISVKATLLGASSHSAGAPGLTASSTVMTAGSGSYSISSSSAAFLAASQRLADDEGNAVADRAHLVGFQDGAQRAEAFRAAHVFRHRRRQLAKPVSLDVGAGQDRQHAVGGRRLCGIDAFDAGMGVRRHHHDAVALVRQIDIVDIAAAPGDETGILDPRHGLTDAELVHACLLRISSPVCTGEDEEVYTWHCR